MNNTSEMSNMLPPSTPNRSPELGAAAVPPPLPAPTRTLTRLTVAAEAVGSENAEMLRLMREDPESPLLCPRHEHIARGGLGPSKNSSGQWGGFYGAPAGSGCRNCKHDAEEERLVGEMCEALARVEREPTRYNLGILRMTMEAFDEFAGPYMVRYERGMVAKCIPDLERKVTEAEETHTCGDPECKWDCGQLSCGCIDMCRGRCGARSERWDGDQWGRRHGGW